MLQETRTLPCIPIARENALKSGSSHESRKGCILIVDTDKTIRERLTRELRSEGYEVITADTGEHAFHRLRDWQHPVDWLYCRADLSSLICGAILADEYHKVYPNRTVIIAGRLSGTTVQGDIILKDPSVDALLQAVRNVIGEVEPIQNMTCVDETKHPWAA